ncbi:MAG: PEP-CTERM sorting domain-containing protein [Pirellulales bacterium]|nr:PEP-CTERM sorting domain-containing protein [Pirellulales bacterium]
MRQILRYANVSLCTLAVLVFASASAKGDLAGWLAEVAIGTPAGYTNTGISGTAPITADIGIYDETTAGGVSYEFIVNAGNGGDSSAFMGSLVAPVGDSAGLKFEQWANTGTYGATAFGVADYDSGIPHILNEDHQVVFVNNGTDTTIYINGVLTGTIAGFSPTLSGVTGIAQAYRHDTGATIDPLDGTLIGVAVYDGALSPDEISTHYRAYIPEPGSFVLLGLCASILGLAWRHRSSYGFAVVP